MSMDKLSFTSAFLAGVLLTSSILNTVNAKNIAIYRWVDNDGVVHFSQNLPKNDDYKEFSTVSSYKALSKEERKLLADQNATEEKAAKVEEKREEVIAKNKALYEKNCKAARMNIKMLNTVDDVHISEESSDGTIVSRSLTPVEKEEKMALSKKHEKTYCG